MKQTQQILLHFLLTTTELGTGPHSMMEVTGTTALHSMPKKITNKAVHNIKLTDMKHTQRIIPNLILSAYQSFRYHHHHHHHQKDHCFLTPILLHPILLHKYQPPLQYRCIMRVSMVLNLKMPNTLPYIGFGASYIHAPQHLNEVEGLLHQGLHGYPPVWTTRSLVLRSLV